MAKPKIMVVEDEKEIAGILASFINNTGRYEALTTHNGKEALELLKKNRRFLLSNKIRLILLDIKMPEMDGLRFLEEMRKTYSDSQIGVLMVTAYEDENKWDRATSGFVVGYIKKPIHETALIEAIDKFFSNPDARYLMTLDTFQKHIKKREELGG